VFSTSSIVRSDLVDAMHRMGRLQGAAQDRYFRATGHEQRLSAVFSGVTMRFLLAVLLVAFATAASARTPVSYSASPQGDLLVLMSEECHLPVTNHPKQAILRLRDGSTYTGCHRATGTIVHLVFDDGDIWEVPVRAFKSVSGSLDHPI